MQALQIDTKIMFTSHQISFEPNAFNNNVEAERNNESINCGFHRCYTVLSSKRCRSGGLGPKADVVS